MRIAELSRQAGVPVATIKYYLREGLLHAGERTSPNQARYDDTHLHRLRLVRAMVQVGGLSIAKVREVLGALDDPERSEHRAMGAMSAALTPRHFEHDDKIAYEQARAFLKRNKWPVRTKLPAFQALVDVLAAARDVGHDRFIDHLDRYVDACMTMAEADVEYAFMAKTRDTSFENVVIGTVLGDAVVAAVRRLAQAEVSGRTLGEVKDEDEPEPDGPDCVENEWDGD
ncbi:MerR family transcriptional regulator [Saccharothrix violaceirubra]|uniref:DNA-binding transcriptional MerR regulator n=1 Tax=Saccharothrix violaceirubra TaxID=413306 RepID=A0A7W7T6P2_9PSEU|nr:MerR family transcriptional regulator [Saccharothrix violaceirubra]MBB4967569.1 DNA-binding transcriptional MerR regulator [Saccharothrix violaceirubra]